MGSLRDELKGDMGSLRDEMSGMRTELKDDVRANGILIEDLRDDTRIIGSQATDLHKKMKTMATDIEEIKANTIDLPFIRQMLRKHEKQLAKLD